MSCWSMLVKSRMSPVEKPISKTANGFSNCTPTVFAWFFYPEQNMRALRDMFVTEPISCATALHMFNISKKFSNRWISNSPTYQRYYRHHRHAYSACNCGRKNRSCIFSIIPWSSLQKISNRDWTLSPSNYRAEYIFQLKQILDLYDYYSSLVTQLDAHSEQCTRTAFVINPKEHLSKPLKRNVHKKTKMLPPLISELNSTASACWPGPSRWA